MVCVEASGALELLAHNIWEMTGGDLGATMFTVTMTSAGAAAFVDNIPFTATRRPIIEKISVDPSGEKMIDMMNLGNNSTSERILSIIIGHEYLSDISNMGDRTELGILKIFTNLGIFTAIPFMSLICYSIYIYLISEKKIKRVMWVPFITVCTGLLTLLHYGSLFRTTSIFLFFTFYSMVIKEYLVYSEKSDIDDLHPIIAK